MKWPTKDGKPNFKYSTFNARADKLQSSNLWKSVISVPVKSPCHSTNSHPSEGLAVNSTVVPCGQSVVFAGTTLSLTDPSPSVFAESDYSLFINIAVTSVSELIVMLAGLELPVWSPCHLSISHIS